MSARPIREDPPEEETGTDNQTLVSREPKRDVFKFQMTVSFNRMKTCQVQNKAKQGMAIRALIFGACLLSTDHRPSHTLLRDTASERKAV